MDLGKLSGLGITVGFHRMLTHKSFETSKPVKALLMIMGCMAWESNPITWASTHIQHHAHSDQENDPHSPLVNLFHAHVGWVFRDGLVRSLRPRNRVLASSHRSQSI